MTSQRNQAAVTLALVLWSAYSIGRAHGRTQGAIETHCAFISGLVRGDARPSGA